MKVNELATVYYLAVHKKNVELENYLNALPEDVLNQLEMVISIGREVTVRAWPYYELSDAPAFDNLSEWRDFLGILESDPEYTIDYILGKPIDKYIADYLNNTTNTELRDKVYKQMDVVLKKWG